MWAVANVSIAINTPAEQRQSATQTRQLQKPDSQSRFITRYGSDAPDFDFTSDTSIASMNPSPLTSSRKLEFVTGFPDCDLIWLTSIIFRATMVQRYAAATNSAILRSSMICLPL